METIEQLKRNANLISELQRDENNRPFRVVNGEKIYQIEEKTFEDKMLNEAINLWRMRKK